ncbi:MAG: hypothetical protein K1X75_02170 [Leptospirales bacterium]|nr:hypothetical protein [Leptospirales bacterium]
MRHSTCLSLLFISFLIVVQSVFVGCERFWKDLREDARGHQLRARGISERPDGDLQWTIAVGALNDSEFSELSRAALTPVLDRTQALLEQRLPGLHIAFILDQPMNSVFLMERSMRSEGGVVRTALIDLNRESEIRNRKLLLDAGRSAAEVTLLLRQLADLQQKALDAERPCLESKLSSSEETWLSYLRHQPRYDLILTNALIFADGVDRRPFSSSDEDGARSVMGGPALGRSGMEGWGLVLSLNSWAPGHSCRRDQDRLPAPAAAEAAAQRIAQALWPLLTALPAGVDLQNKTPANEPVRLSWSKRLELLRSYLRFSSGDRRACEFLTTGAAHQGRPSPPRRSSADESRSGAESDFRSGAAEAATTLEEQRQITLDAYLDDCKKTE